MLKTHPPYKNLSNLALYIYNIQFKCSCLVDEEKIMASSGHQVPLSSTKRKN
jgi:hypothetical protein